MTDEEGSEVISVYTDEDAIRDGIKVRIAPNVTITTNLLQQLVKPLVDKYDAREDKDDLMVTIHAVVTPASVGIPVWLIEDGNGLTLLAPEDY